MRACAEHAHTHAGDTRSLRSLVCSPFPPVPLPHSHHKTQPTPSTGDTRSLRSLAGYHAAPHSHRSPSRSRARSARLGFLLPARGGNPRTPSAGLGTGLRNRQSTSLGPIPSGPPPSRSLRSLDAAPRRLPAAASGGASGLAALGSSALPYAIACRPHYALIGCRPAKARLPIVYRLPHCATLQTMAYGLQCARGPAGLGPSCALDSGARSEHIIGGSGAPCGGRGYRGGPRPAKGANTPASAKASAPLLRPKGRCAPCGARIGAFSPAALATLGPEV